MGLHITVYTGPEFKTVTSTTFYKKIGCADEMLALRNGIIADYPQVAVTVHASYDELAYIAQQFTNLPIPNTEIPVWTGDLAMLIVNNIELD